MLKKLSRIYILVLAKLVMSAELHSQKTLTKEDSTKDTHIFWPVLLSFLLTCKADAKRGPP